MVLILRGALPIKRKNGFQFPLHPYQVLSWVFFLITVVANILIIGRPLPSPYNIVFYIFVTGLELLVFIFAFITTTINPADDFSQTHVMIVGYCIME